MRSMHIRYRLAVALILLSGILAIQGPGEPRTARADRSCLYFEFDKGTNINSTLYWRWMDDLGRCIYSHSWRAGSGDTQDACQVNHGWLPNGWYDLKSTGHRDDYDGRLIKGRVWSLQDKACRDGIVRTALFIHTEETRAQGQECRPDDPDDQWCWDSTAAPGGSVGSNDYFSQGCIKVRRKSPEGNWANDMKAADDDWHAAGLGQAGGRTDTVYVHN